MLLSILQETIQRQHIRLPRTIWKSVQLLAIQPGLGRPGRVNGIRELIISGLPYIVPYIEQDETIIIRELCTLRRNGPLTKEAQIIIIFINLGKNTF